MEAVGLRIQVVEVSIGIYTDAYLDYLDSQSNSLHLCSYLTTRSLSQHIGIYTYVQYTVSRGIHALPPRSQPFCARSFVDRTPPPPSALVQLGQSAYRLSIGIYTNAQSVCTLSKLDESRGWRRGSVDERPGAEWLAPWWQSMDAP